VSNIDVLYGGLFREVFNSYSAFTDQTRGYIRQHSPLGKLSASGSDFFSHIVMRVCRVTFKKKVKKRIEKTSMCRIGRVTAIAKDFGNEPNDKRNYLGLEVFYLAEPWNKKSEEQNKVLVSKYVNGIGFVVEFILTRDFDVEHINLYVSTITQNVLKLDLLFVISNSGEILTDARPKGEQPKKRLPIYTFVEDMFISKPTENVQLANYLF
jgi:hypothetical protein